MGQSWKAITEQIQQLKLLMDSDAEGLLRSLGPSEPPSKLLTRLVKANKLTKYQARQLLDGKAARLRLGNYVILGPIGEGAMGRVMKACHVQMNRIVAIKTLNRETAKRQVNNKRFENEIRFVSQLSHPNIVQAYDAGIHNGVPYLVNEYIEGIDLQQLVAKSGPLMIPNVLRYMTQAASSLAYAHSHKIIHRDVKPANFMINREGQIKLLDLGLARLNASDEEESIEAGLTDEHVIVGSCAFMAPELAKSPKAFGPLTDIYSLGCTLFYLLNGRIPYTGKTYMETFLAHAQSPIPKLCPTDTPQAVLLNQLFHKMVAKNPQVRISSMAEIAAEMKKISEMDVEAEPASLSSMNVAIPQVGLSTDSEWLLTDPAVAKPEQWYTRKSALAIGMILVSACIGGVVFFFQNPAQAPDVKESGPQIFVSEPGGGLATSKSAPVGTQQKAKVQQGTATKVFSVNDDETTPP